MGRLERLVMMADEINKGRNPTVEHFCREFEVQERTVYDDIRALKEMLGLNIAYDRFRGGYVNRNPAKTLPEFNLTDGEVFALTLGKEMLSQYTGTSFEPILQNAIEKICERLPNSVKVDPTDVLCMVKFNPGGIIPISRKMFLDLNRACENHSSVDISYYGAKKGEVSQRTIDPYRLLENRGTWYVVAYCHTQKDLRIFALHRIEKLTLLDEHFHHAENIDMDKWIESAFLLEHGDIEQTVKIHFQPLAARYIRERQWHHSQKLHEYKDGSCTLEFVTQSLDEVKRWVLIYGAEAEVLEPLILRDIVHNELKTAITQYD